jgi:hypothetical protein
MQAIYQVKYNKNTLYINTTIDDTVLAVDCRIWQVHTQELFCLIN